MDNNNSQRPRKRLSRETARKRQLAALGVIALLVLIFIILIAKACSKDDTKKGGNTKPTEDKNIVTTISTTQDSSLTTTSVTTTAPVTNPDGSNDSGFKLDKYSVYLDVGGTDMPWVMEYPEGSSEPDEIWSSSDEKIATVDGKGNITAVSPGECYIILKTAKDPTKEIQVKVVVADGGVQQTSNTDGTQPANLAEAPPPPVYDMDGLTYKEGILIANKTYSMPAEFNPGLESICSEHFQALSSAAAKEGLNLWIGSGYRSYYDQDIIYNNYVAMDGAEMADTYSARPGFSEHQTGLVIDCNTIDDAFGATPEAAWLAEHAHEYGFIIRYPKGKEDITGYKYEPWHIRYVGSKVATECYKRGICLEEYLGVDSYYH